MPDGFVMFAETQLKILEGDISPLVLEAKRQGGEVIGKEPLRLKENSKQVKSPDKTRLKTRALRCQPTPLTQQQLWDRLG